MAQARAAERKAVCASKGWEFSLEDPLGLTHRWDGSPFGAGRRRRAFNVVQAKVGGRSMVAVEYSYVTGYGKDKDTHYWAVVAITIPCTLPALHLGPEDVVTRLGGVLGFEDIDLESEDFNRAFLVRCPSRKFAHDVLTPRTMEALLAAGPVELRFCDRAALCVSEGHLDPGVLLAQVDIARKVVDGIPSFVWRDHGVVL